jgi:hypothetical protein
MKLKCNDGITRTFQLPWKDSLGDYQDAFCEECGKSFGVHDTKILKPMFKEHTCIQENSPRA